MTRKRESSPNGHRKLSKPNVAYANARRQTRNKMEVPSIDDKNKTKTRTTTHVPVTDEVTGSQESDHSSVKTRGKRGRKPKTKLDTNLFKNSEELVSTEPLATVGHHSHVNKLHRKRREDTESASTSLAAAVTEAREGLSSKLAKAPIQTLNQQSKNIKQSAKRKIANRIVKLKGLGRKERKFINNLQSYRDQPSIVTRLKEVNVIKPKPRKRTLSGEFELLDEGLLRKQIKFDAEKAYQISNTSQQRKQKRSIKISKLAEGVMENKALKKRSVSKIKHHTFNKRVSTIGINPNERHLVSRSKLRTKYGAPRKLHSSEDTKDSESCKSSSSSDTIKITSTLIRKVKKPETLSNEQEKKRGRKKKALKYTDPPILFAESDDQEVSFKDRTTVASSPPPVLEKAVDSVPSSLDVVQPIKRKRGRPRLVPKEQLTEEYKTEVQVITAELGSMKTESTEESKSRIQEDEVDSMTNLKEESETDDFKTNDASKDTQFRKRKPSKASGFIVHKKAKNASRTVSILKKNAHVKAEAGIRLKTKRSRGTYDFPGKKKLKQSTERKSALFHEVNNVRAGKRKPKQFLKDFTATNLGDIDMETKTVDNNKLIATETVGKDLSLIKKPSTSNSLMEEGTTNKSELTMTNNILSEDSMLYGTTVTPFLHTEALPTLIRDSDNDSDLDDLPLVLFKKKASPKSVDMKFKSIEPDISSSMSTIHAGNEPSVFKKDVPKSPLRDAVNYTETAVLDKSDYDAKYLVSTSGLASCFSVQILPAAAAVSTSDETLKSSKHEPCTVVLSEADTVMVATHTDHLTGSGLHAHLVTLNSEHSISVPFISDASCSSVEMKQSVSNASPSQHIGMSTGEQIQFTSVHLKTGSVLIDDQKVKSGSTDSSTVTPLHEDDGDKSEDANNNASGDGQADDTFEIPCPCVADCTSSDKAVMTKLDFSSNSVDSGKHKNIVLTYDPVTHPLHDKASAQSGDTIVDIASKGVCELDRKHNDSKRDLQPISIQSQSLDAHSEQADATLHGTSESSCTTGDKIATNVLLNKTSTKLNLCSDDKENIVVASTSFVENAVVVSCDADITVVDGRSKKEQQKPRTIEAAGTKQVQHPAIPSNSITEISGLKVKLTKNKGNYEISGHSQSTGSESDETQHAMEQKEIKYDEQDVFSESPVTSNKAGSVLEKQNTLNESVPSSDNRRVPPLKIKFKNRVTKPVRQFALRPKLTRSPIEIIAMKQRKIEEEYQQHEAYRLARRLEKQITKRKLLNQAKLATDSKIPAQSHESFSNIHEMLALCKPCCVTLVDFVKQLHLGKSEIENSLAQTSNTSHVHGEKSKGIKLKIKNISKQPKIVGKRGRPPKLKPKHPVYAPPVNELTTVHVDKEKSIAELNEKGFVGSFVEFLKKSTDHNVYGPMISSIQKEDSSQLTEKDPSQTTENDISQTTEKEDLKTFEGHTQIIDKDLSQTVQKDPSTMLSDTQEITLQSNATGDQKMSMAKYCCKTCDFTTTVKQTIELHVYRHIPDINFKCGFCDLDFACMASACAHTKNEHIDQESNILKSREVTESDHYFAVEDMPPLEKNASQPASGQLAADGSTPVVINVVVKGNVALSSPAYSVPSKRFICTHCKYSTNVKGDINQHVLDLHASDNVYICTLCSESFYVSEQEMANHCASTHPSRPCPYRLLPSFYDIEQLKNAQKMKQDDRGNIFERMTNLFQASPTVDENQPEEVVRKQHYHRAREFLYIQEGWMTKTSAEADSTTRDTENLMDTPPTDLDEDQQPVSTEGLTETDESLKPVDIAPDLVYEEQQIADDTLQDDSGISELKIIDVVSLRDQQHIMDQSMSSESPVNITEPVQQCPDQIVSQPAVQKSETVTKKVVERSIKSRSNTSTRNRSSNLPEIDVDAIVQRNERLTCTYKCQKCNIHSPYLSAMVEHLKNHHTDIELFTCPYCKGSRGKRPQFSSEHNVHEHVKLMHPTNFSKNEVSLSDAAKEFVQVIAIPSGSECSKVGNTFVIEKDIYMCLRCQAHMPSLDYTFSHLEREHTEVFVYVCPHCKVFKDKTDEVVFKHISDSHNLEITDDSLPLAIEDNLFIRVPSISKSGSYSERVHGNRNSNQKADKVKLSHSKIESNVPKVTSEPSTTLSKSLSVGHTEKRITENVNKSVTQTLIGGAGQSSAHVVKKAKTANKYPNTSRINPRKQADPSQALLMDCESIDDPVLCADNIDDICNEDVQIVSCEPTITTSSRVTSVVGNVQGSTSNNLVSLNRVESDKTGVTSLASHSSNVVVTSNILHSTQSPAFRASILPLNKISSINQCAPRLKSSIYSIADRLHRLHAQNKAHDKLGLSGERSSSNSPVAVSRAVLKVPSVPLRNATPVTHPQTVASQSLLNVISGHNSVSGRVASPSVSGVQKQKSLLFSNCPLDLSGIPLSQNTVSSAEQLTNVTSLTPQPPVSKDEEIRPESFQIFNLKPKRKTDSPQVLPARAVQQQTASPTAHAAAATILSNAQQVTALQPIHQAYPLAQLAPLPFQQVPIRFGIGMPNFIATGQPTLITLRQPLMGPRVPELVNFQRMSIPQQGLQIQQQQILQVSKAHTSDSVRSSEQAVSGINTMGTQPDGNQQRPACHNAPVSQPPKYVAATLNNTSVRQQLLQQAEFYCPYCSEFRPLREYEVLPHIQRSHPRKEVLYLRRDKSQ